jgi:hypothetical protein
MALIRTVQAPAQEESRVVVLGVELWTDHVILHASVESDQVEIEEPFWEDDQIAMFAVTDDGGTDYRRGSASGSGDDEDQIWTYRIKFWPAVPEGVRALTVSHLAGSVELFL